MIHAPMCHDMCKVRDQDKNWTPHFCCMACIKRLTEWAKGSRHINFVIHVVWHGSQDHLSGIIYCVLKIVALLMCLRFGYVQFPFFCPNEVVGTNKII